MSDIRKPQQSAEHRSQQEHQDHTTAMQPTPYQALFELMADGTCLLEILFNNEKQPVDALIVEANNGFREYIEVDDPLGRTLQDVIPELDSSWYELLGEVAVTGEAHQTEMYAEPLERWFRLYAARSGNRDCRRVACVFNDISEQKRAEQDLRKNEARFRQALDIHAIGVLFFDDTGTLLDANDAFLKMTGFSNDEVTSGNMTWRTCTPPEWIDKSLQQLDQLKETGRIGPYEKEYLNKDGSRSWMLFSGTQLADGTIVEYCIDISDRKEAEAALRESELRFRRLLNSTAEAIYGLDTEGSCTFVNKACLGILGYEDPDELIGQNMHDLIHHTKKDGTPYPEEECEIFKAFTNGEEIHLDNEVLWRRDGSSFPAEYWSRPKLRDGEVVGAVVSFLDISDRVEAERALRESKERLRILADTVPAMIWMTDTENRCTALNRRWTESTGQPEKEGLGFGWLDMVHPEDRKRTRQQFLFAAGQREPFSLDFRLHQEDGSYRWVVDKGEPRFDEDGNWCGYIGSVTDVHERKLASNARQESEERYRTLFTSMGEGFCVIEMIYDDDQNPVDYRFIEANPAFERHTGLTDAVGHKARRLVPNLEDHWVKLYAEVARTGEAKQFLQGSEAMERWFEVQAFRVGNEGSNRVALLFSDITEQKAAEEELKQLNEHLEERVQERTQQVRDLVSKLAMAEQAERRRISQILHDDVQQLLYGIDLKMNMIRQNLEESDVRDLKNDLREARDWISRAVEMTRHLTVDLSPPVLQNEGLSDKLTWLQRQMKELHGLQISIDAEKDFRIPDKDLRLLLFQIVRELLFNVKKHAGVDEANVRVSKKNGYLVLRVVDEGRGFDPKRLAADDPEGFGLHSIKERLRLVGGKLRVNAERGEGTEVQVHVPV